MKAKALVITGNGTNCENESVHALKTAGADLVVQTNIWDLMAGKVKISDFNFICLPGGFLDGDHLGSAQAAAHRFKYGKPLNNDETLLDQLKEVIQNNGLIIGICNGFQLLVKLGLLPITDGQRRVTLTHNKNGRFEDRWVKVKINQQSPCVFTKNIEETDLPVRHGEGRLVYANREVSNHIKKENLIPLSYCHPENYELTEEYPFNPNGSTKGAASLCDKTGRIFGLMPHPEAYTHYTNHPQWTRKNLPPQGEGLKFFINGINYLINN